MLETVTVKPEIARGQGDYRAEGHTQIVKLCRLLRIYLAPAAWRDRTIDDLARRRRRKLQAIVALSGALRRRLVANRRLRHLGLCRRLPHGRAEDCSPA